MATFQTFVDIEAWQKARALVYEIYEISISKDFRLRGQIPDASISIMSNIAEGFERDGTAEFVQFLAIAKGSTGESFLSSTSPLIKGILLKMTLIV